jgi:hypothetical protein
LLAITPPNEFIGSKLKLPKNFTVSFSDNSITFKPPFEVSRKLLFVDVSAQIITIGPIKDGKVFISTNMKNLNQKLEKVVSILTAAKETAVNSKIA